MGDTQVDLLRCIDCFMLLIFGLWRLWASLLRCPQIHRRGRGDAQIDGADPMAAKMNAEDAIFGCGPHCQHLSAEWLADADAAVAERNVAFLVGFAHDVAVPVFDRRQGLRKGAGACSVT